MNEDSEDQRGHKGYQQRISTRTAEGRRLCHVHQSAWKKRSSERWNGFHFEREPVKGELLKRGTLPFNTQEIQVKQDGDLRKRDFEAGPKKKNRDVDKYYCQRRRKCQGG